MKNNLWSNAVEKFSSLILEPDYTGINPLLPVVQVLVRVFNTLMKNFHIFNVNKDNNLPHRVVMNMKWFYTV